MPDRPPSAPTGPEPVDGPQAPLVSFDSVPTFGMFDGIFTLTLCAGLVRPRAGRVVTQQTITAHLRSSRRGLMALRDSIDRALLLAAEPVRPDGTN